MRSRFICSVVIELVVLFVVSTFAEQTESLGDAARRLRLEKQNASQPTIVPDGSAKPSQVNGVTLVPFGGPVSRLQILAWIVGGVSEEDLVYELKTSGLSFEPDDACLREIGAISSDRVTHELETAPKHLEGSQSNKSDAVEQMSKVATAAKKKDYRGALNVLKPLLQADSSNPDLLFAVGGILIAAEDWSRSMMVLARAIQVSPDFPYAHGQLSYSYYRMGSGEAAVSEARIVVKMRPNSSDAHKLLGLGLSIEEDYSGALKEYNEAIRLNPNNANVYYDIGVMRVDQNDWESAVTAYQKSLKLKPGNEKVYNNLGIALDKAGRLNDAIEAFEKRSRLGRPWA